MGTLRFFLALVTETQGNKSITQTSSSRSFFYHPLSLCHTGTHPSSPKTYSLSLNTLNNYLHPASFLKNFQMICLPFFCQTISFTSHFCLPLLFTHHISPLLLSCSLWKVSTGSHGSLCIASTHSFATCAFPTCVSLFQSLSYFYLLSASFYFHLPLYYLLIFHIHLHAI